MLLMFSYNNIIILNKYTTYKILSHTHTMIITNRYYSTRKCDIEQLSSDIDFIHKDIFEHSISSNRLSILQYKLFNGLYSLSPIRVKFIKLSDLDPFLKSILLETPDIGFIPFPDDPTRISVVIPEKEDVLVYMALSLMLFRLSHGRLPELGYRLENLTDSFYNSIKQMGKVDRVYRIDLSPSLSMIPRSLILDKVKPLVGDGSVYNLISSFLCLPIIDDIGNNRSDIRDGCVPPVGEITRVLFNIVLMDIFDREFTKRIPGITFYRHIYEVFISTRGNEEGIFNDKVGHVLLEELGMDGKIESIGPGDPPLSSCYRKQIYLNNESKVCLRDPMESYYIITKEGKE
jgi:hypothetical protein